MIHFVIGLLQGLAFAFFVYGAFLAASSRMRPVPEEGLEPRPERRRRMRRKADRRNAPGQDLYGVPM